MTSTPSFSIRNLCVAMVAGVCSFSASAGQKIEYSVPTDQVAAPNPAKEQRDAALFPEKSKLQFNATPDFNLVTAPIFVNPGPARKRDSVFGQKDDVTGSENSNPDDVTKKSTRDKISDPLFDSQRARDTGRPTSADLGRLPDVNDARKLPGATSHALSDSPATLRNGRDSTAPWSHDFKSRSFFGSDNPGKESKSFFDRPTVSAANTTPGSPNDPLRGLAWPDKNGKSFNPSQPDLSRPDHFFNKPDATPGAAFGNPTYRANVPVTRDSRAPSAGSGYYQQGTYTAPPPPPKRVAPPTLDFPKRPNDPFR